MSSMPLKLVFDLLAGGVVATRFTRLKFAGNFNSRIDLDGGICLAS